MLIEKTPNIPPGRLSTEIGILKELGYTILNLIEQNDGNWTIEAAFTDTDIGNDNGTGSSSNGGGSTGDNTPTEQDPSDTESTVDISGSGWEMLISRLREDERNGRRRTVGKYQVFHDGQPVQGLSGMVCEPRGPGDNTTAGKNKRRIEVGTYPLFTQNGAKYKTINYTKNQSSSALPRPGIELMKTGERSEILIHPARGFLSSTGCINTARKVPHASSNIEFVDSRKLTIALIEDMKSFLGSDFPDRNGRNIPHARVIVRFSDSSHTESETDSDVLSLLELIGKAESRQNYNAYFGKVNNKTNPELISMTINNVLTWQDQFVAQGSPSSAAGRYQIIRKTLRGLKTDMGLSGSEKFNQQMQDKMAVQLLKRRKLGSFRAGVLSSAEFANNLAKEWASLPMVSGPKKGKSYYAGDGLNKALISVSAILKAIDTIRR